MLLDQRFLALSFSLVMLSSCTAQPAPVEPPPLPEGVTRVETSRDRQGGQCEWYVDFLQDPDSSDQDLYRSLQGLATLAGTKDQSPGLKSCLRERAHSELLAFLTNSSSHPALRPTTAQALKSLADETDTAALLDAVGNGCADCLQVFEELHDPEALDALTTAALARSGDGGLAAAKALGNYPEDLSRKTLVQVARTTPDPPVLVAALTSLANIAHPDDYWRVAHTPKRIEKILPTWFRRQPTTLYVTPGAKGIRGKSRGGDRRRDNPLTPEEEVMQSLTERYTKQASKQLAQLRKVAGPPPEVFTDGFESGDVKSWAEETETH